MKESWWLVGPLVSGDPVNQCPTQTKIPISSGPAEVSLNHRSGAEVSGCGIIKGDRTDVVVSPNERRAEKANGQCFRLMCRSPDRQFGFLLRGRIPRLKVLLQFFRKRDAPECVTSLHGLRESGKLVAWRHFIIAMPQLLADVRFIPTSPLLDKTRFVFNRLVVATSIPLSETLYMCAENIPTSISFQ